MTWVEMGTCCPVLKGSHSKHGGAEGSWQEALGSVGKPLADAPESVAALLLEALRQERERM